MFNTNNNINISKHHSCAHISPPACIGTLQKSHPKSFFKRFHCSSTMADWVFSDEPYLEMEGDYSKIKVPIVILQIMTFGDEELMAELVRQDEFNTIEQ